jgi:5-methylthioadenosine/S-adenosylhomocysteine deaminase
LGLLSPQTILAHCVHLTDDDRSLIAETGAVISHMPVSNQKLCSGILDFTAALDAGCKVTIGTDGCSSNNNLSMFDEMKCAALSAKVKTGNPTCGKDVDIYRAATISGADAFNINAGEIAVGKEADAILIELDHPQMVGDYNLISNMVYSADTSVVDTTICRGKVLMEHRVVAGESEIISAARAVCRKLSGR